MPNDLLLRSSYQHLGAECQVPRTASHKTCHFPLIGGSQNQGRSPRPNPLINPIFHTGTEDGLEFPRGANEPEEFPGLTRTKDRGQEKDSVEIAGSPWGRKHGIRPSMVSPSSRLFSGRFFSPLSLSPFFAVRGPNLDFRHGFRRKGQPPDGACRQRRRPFHGQC